MNIKIKRVKNYGDLKLFVKFPFGIYADHPHWTPTLVKEALETFTPGKNPAYQQAETRLFLAYNDQRIVGRIAGILSHAANDKYQTDNLRFGWFDTVEDLNLIVLIIYLFEQVLDIEFEEEHHQIQYWLMTIDFLKSFR